MNTSHSADERPFAPSASQPHLLADLTNVLNGAGISESLCNVTVRSTSSRHLMRPQLTFSLEATTRGPMAVACAARGVAE